MLHLCCSQDCQGAAQRVPGQMDLPGQSGFLTTHAVLNFILHVRHDLVASIQEALVNMAFYVAAFLSARLERHLLVSEIGAPVTRRVSPTKANNDLRRRLVSWYSHAAWHGCWHTL